MDSSIEETTRWLLEFPLEHWQKCFDDAELLEIDSLLDIASYRDFWLGWFYALNANDFSFALFSG